MGIQAGSIPLDALVDIFPRAHGGQLRSPSAISDLTPQCEQVGPAARAQHTASWCNAYESRNHGDFVAKSKDEVADLGSRSNHDR